MQRIEFFLGKKNKEIEKKINAFGFNVIYFVKKVSDLREIKKEEQKDYDLLFIETDSIELLRRMIDKASNHFKILVLGTNDKINRIALENKKTLGLISPENQRTYDYMDYRNSGLNHVLCKIAKENSKIIIEKLSDLDAVLRLGKIIQNFHLCKKFKTNIQLSNFSDNLKNIKNAFELRDIEKVLLNKEHFEHEKITII